MKWALFALVTGAPAPTYQMSFDMLTACLHAAYVLDRVHMGMVTHFCVPEVQAHNTPRLLEDSIKRLRQ